MADTCEDCGEERANVETMRHIAPANPGETRAGMERGGTRGDASTRTAVRVRRGDRVLYLMPYTDQGRCVLFEQDAASFETTRDTVDAVRARTLRAAGREVPLHVTPAWCDPAAPTSV